MADSGHGGRGRPAAELRASHADRERVVELLQVAAGEGRLTVDELDERLEAALTARTHGDLAVLTADLPASILPPAGRPAQAAKDLVRIDCGSGTARRDGRWLVPRRMEVRVVSGRVVLNLTEAVITVPLLTIDAQVHIGSLRLVTRPGIEVDIEKVAVRSGIARVGAPRVPAVPVTLRVEVSGRVGSGTLKARPRRLPSPKSLLRRPRYALPAAR
jgi:hypothetical protein